MSLKQLWAPWRMEFLTEAKKKSDEGCFFCDALKGKDDRKNLVVHRAKKAFIILNKYPYNSGHLMVVPHTHTGNLSELPQDELRELMLVAQSGTKALEHAYKPQGFNIGMNIGEAGGAGVKGHLHLHVIPRWNGDTNFLPIISETKSIPQHLMTSYDQIYEYFRRT